MKKLNLALIAYDAGMFMINHGLPALNEPRQVVCRAGIDATPMRGRRSTNRIAWPDNLEPAYNGSSAAYVGFPLRAVICNDVA